MSERDREKMERTAMEMMADDAVSERDKFASMLHDCENERDGWRHRAERAERVVEAAREFVDAGYGGEDDDAEWMALHEAVRALDAAQGE